MSRKSVYKKNLIKFSKFLEVWQDANEKKEIKEPKKEIKDDVKHS